jgi:CRP-like cAMP-binding protein
MWTVISNVLIVSSLLVSLVAIFLAARSVVAVSELRQAWLVLRPLDSKSFETRLHEAESALSLLANRVKMQKVRNAITHVERDKGGEPDAKSDPEAWRAWMNAQLRIAPRNPQ